MVKYVNILIDYIKQRNDQLSFRLHSILNPLRNPKVFLEYYIFRTIHHVSTYQANIESIVPKVSTKQGYYLTFSAVAYRCSTHALVKRCISKAFYSCNMGSSAHLLNGFWKSTDNRVNVRGYFLLDVRDYWIGRTTPLIHFASQKSTCSVSSKHLPNS